MKNTNSLSLKFALTLIHPASLLGLSLASTACGGGIGASALSDSNKGDASTAAMTSTFTSAPASSGAGSPTLPSGATARPTLTWGPTANAPVNSYSQQASGLYTAVNNTWGVKNLPRGWTQRTGISALQPDGSVAFAANWNFPMHCGSCEVLSYPEIVYGRAAGIEPVEGAKLPKAVKDVRSLVSQYSRIDGNAIGKGHVTYDLWTARSADSMAPPQRLAEIMLPVESFGGYGVPNSPPAAAAGRSGQLAAGRNPKGYIERKDIGGVTYDIYYNAPGALMQWAFIVFQPVTPLGRNGHITNWMPLLDYMQDKNWVSPDDYLANVEFGVEAVTTPGGASGDLTISGFKVTTD